MLGGATSWRRSRLAILKPGVDKWLLDWRSFARLGFSLLSFVLVLFLWINLLPFNVLSLRLLDLNFNVLYSLISWLVLFFLLSKLLRCKLFFIPWSLSIILLIHKLNLLLLHELVSFSFLSLDENITNLSSMIKVHCVVLNKPLHSFSHVVDLWELDE